MRKWKALAASCLLALSLSGCSVVQGNTEDLMVPPQLTPEQNALSSALTEALGTDNFNLKYPFAGDYRSAYVLHNLDSEDGDEAVVFYQLTGDSGVRMNILDRDANGDWQSVYDTAGSGEEIYSVHFAPISNSGCDNLIVSWREQGRSYQNVEVYHYEKGALSSLFSSTGSYIHFFDSNRDGYSEMLLLGWDRSQTPSAQIVRRAGPRVISQDDLFLNDGVLDFAGVSFGYTGDGKQAIFIDELVSSDTLATEVITVENFKLKNLMEIPADEQDERFDSQTALYEETMRDSDLLCADLDGDGVVEIPTSELMPGYSTGGEGEAIYRTTYRTLTGDGLEEAYSTVRNPEMGYTFRLPERWLEDVTIKRVPQGNEWQFVYYNDSLEDSTELLLSIRVTSHQDHLDKFEENNYFLLAQRGIFEYHASIPKTDHPLLLSEDEVRANFMLSSNDSAIGG